MSRMDNPRRMRHIERIMHTGTIFGTRYTKAGIEDLIRQACATKEYTFNLVTPTSAPVMYARKYRHAIGINGKTYYVMVDEHPEMGDNTPPGFDIYVCTSSIAQHTKHLISKFGTDTEKIEELIHIFDGYARDP